MKDYEKEQRKKWEYLAWAIDAIKKSNGDIDELEKKARARGMFSAPIGVSDKELDSFRKYVTENMFQTFLATFLYALKETEGFGKKRLRRMQEAFAEISKMIMETDFAGQPYVCISDIAMELNEQYDLGLDLSLLTKIERESNAKRTHFVSRERIQQDLIQHGFKDAAEYLSKK